MLRHPNAGHRIKDAIRCIPYVAVEPTVTPITRTVLRVVLSLRPDFEWHDKSHGHSLRYILWVEDSKNDIIYHNETWTLTRKMMQVGTTLRINHLFEDFSSQEGELMHSPCAMCDIHQMLIIIISISSSSSNSFRIGSFLCLSD
jgi:hypothetical protein